MRTKKIEGTPRVILNMKEAHAILEILNDYSWRMGEIEGFTEEAREAEKLYEELDEAILKAEAIY